MVLSLEPLASIEVDQASEPTQFVWPTIVRTCFCLLTSQICTTPSEVPTPTYWPLLAQPIEVTELWPKSVSFVTQLVAADQR